MITITVVIPTHNRINDLCRALKSVYAQTILPDEIIIVDDGSAPSVPLSIFGNVSSKTNVKLLRNDLPRGANYSRNRGLYEAQGDLVAFLDDDDEYMSEKIDNVMQSYNRTNADVIYHPVIAKYDKEGVSYKTTMVNDITFRRMLVKNLIGGASAIVFKKKSFIAIGGFNEALSALQDYEACLRCAKAELNFYLIDKPLSIWHCNTDVQAVSKSLSYNQKALKLIFKKYTTEYSILTNIELKERDEWISGMTARKLLLNKKNVSASISYFYCFLYRKKTSYLIAAFFSLFGIKAFVLILSLKNKFLRE